MRGPDLAAKTLMLSDRKRISVVAAISCGLLVSACAPLKSLTGLNALRQQLIRKYHDEVSVNLQNSRYLSVVFVNSSLNKQEPLRRVERAQDAARFVALNFEGIKTVDEVWISFMDSETRAILFHYNRVIDSFGFDRNGASLDSVTIRDNAPVYDESKKETDARAPLCHYLTTNNETDISVTRIQLEGSVNQGIALVPHFKVTGNACVLGTATAPPEYVALDFASYSNKPLFEGSPALEIYCDDRLALKGNAQLIPTSESGIEESIGQYLSARVSFKLLRRMARSNHVRIVLASKQFQLLPDDINALARIAAYVPDTGNTQ
jgi:hypothetical protein